MRDAEKKRIVDEWKAVNGYDLLSAYSTAVSELARLRKLFDAAGQGEHNVLALVDHYQQEALDANARLQAVRALLERNGCDCDCGHDSEGHDDGCDRCLACRVDCAVRAGR